MTCGDCPDNTASPRGARAWCMVLRNWRWPSDKCVVTPAMRRAWEEGGP